MSAQCNVCHFKYPIRTNLGGHLAMKHGVFEEVANETVLETIEKEPNDEDNARIMRNYKNHVMSYVLGCLNVKAVVKCLL